MESVDPQYIMHIVAQDTGLNPTLDENDSLKHDLPFVHTHQLLPLESGDGDIQLSISTAFGPVNKLGPTQPDLIMSTSDGVLFYVHVDRLLTPSTNGFNSMLSTAGLMDNGVALQVPETSAVMNIFLHALYGMAAVQFRPSITEIVAAVDAMRTYGLSIPIFLASGTTTYTLVLSVAPISPLECYVLAAMHNLDELAVAVSPYMLLMNLSELTDATAMKIGPVYLRRLFFLHIGRVEALKRILLAPPDSHPYTGDCGIFDQRRLRNAWTLAVGSLTWDAKPGISNGAIDSALRSLNDFLTCPICKALLRERIRDVLVQWSLVKQTI